MSGIRRAIEYFGSQQKLAEAAGVSPQAVSFWINNERRISAECAIRVEEATSGAVDRRSLRPDLFGDADSASIPSTERAA